MSTAIQGRSAYQGTDPAAGTVYTIKITNESSDTQNAIVFQEPPTAMTGVSSLAWLSKQCPAEMYTRFTWSLDYNFVWGTNGQLRPGTNYLPGQVIPANLTNANQTTLSYMLGGFVFSQPAKGRNPGTLTVLEDNTVPGPGAPNEGCVGIGMAGYGIYVTPTRPAGSIEFAGVPNYWIALGPFQQGAVITKPILTRPTPVAFPAGMCNASASYDGTNWNITYSTTPQP